MSLKTFQKFLSDYRVLLSGIGIIVGVHWGWWKLQQNPALVDRKDQRDLPIFTMPQESKASVIGSKASETITDSEGTKDLKG